MLKKSHSVAIWLYFGVFLILLMVTAGGAVRLTDSGLSIVKWNPITGIIPPLNEKEWQKEFNDYKKIPEFQIQNNDFSINDFKKIYLWEYFHRLIARIIGFVFLIPFIFFWVKSYFKEKNLLLKVSLIFLFALFQAWLGWYMVKSGFSDRTDVSHYRLAIHLVFATLLASYVLWIALSLTFDIKEISLHKGLAKSTLISLILILVQLCYGAFTAGLNAGYYYPQYPKMGGEWIPQLGIQALEDKGLLSLINDPSLVHFIHRWFAIVVLVWLVVFFFRYIKKLYDSKLKFLFRLGLTIVTIQVILGILTVITGINFVLALLHQVNGIILFLTFIAILYFVRLSKMSKNNVPFRMD